MTNRIYQKLLVVATVCFVQLVSSPGVGFAQENLTTSTTINAESLKKENPDAEDDLIVPTNVRVQLGFIDTGDDSDDNDPIVPTNLELTSGDVKVAENDENTETQGGSPHSISPPNG